MTNMRRLLKSFHKSLLEESQTEAETAIARLLRSRRGRDRISEQLAAHIEKGEALDLQSELMKAGLRVAVEDKQLVENWLGGISE